MKCTSVLAFATSAMAAAIPQAGTTTPLRFGGLALATGTEIHFSPLAANGLAFYIGKNTTTYCPEDTVANCAASNTNETIFSYFNGGGGVSLDTTVPGGQQVYVTEGDETSGQLAGQLKFTQAHSTVTSGPALYDGFTTAYDGIFQFEGKDWFACEIDEFGSGYGIWSVARLAGSNAGEACIAFTWKVVQVDDTTPTAWQYVK